MQMAAGRASNPPGSLLVVRTATGTHFSSCQANFEPSIPPASSWAFLQLTSALPLSLHLRLSLKSLQDCENSHRVRCHSRGERTAGAGGAEAPPERLMSARSSDPHIPKPLSLDKTIYRFVAKGKKK